MSDEPSIATRAAAALGAAEPIIVAGIIGIGAELASPSMGVLAFGLAWFVALLVELVRRRR